MTIISIFGIIAAVLLGAVLLAAVIFLISKLFGMTFVILRNIFRFIGEEVTDTLRFVGAILASILFAPLVVLSIVIGRWSASKHYAGAFTSELRAAGGCIYRICIGNFARLFGVSEALEGIEHRVPEMMAAAPTRDKPAKRVGMFDGYKIVGSLKGGGSGGKLYIAEPDEVKQAVFAKRKLGSVDQVVIKVFSLKDGSSLPQIVRESRALDAARSLGLVLEHQMAPERFFYVMRYVPGEALSVVTQRLHSLSSIEGLGDDHLRSVMSYSEDLLVALDTYHNAELWHKDVKPDNIIVDGRGRDAKAHLVDFGLITPMRSAMTLTTHGTEYFRDPELVRQALRGVKVHQIDGSKFDVYGAGAVLFSMIENSFPAHGGLSQLTKRCPEALRWIVRRSMAEYDRRYPSAAAMLADLRVVLDAQDPFKVKPIDLPSVSQGDVAAAERVQSVPTPDFGIPVNVAGSPVPPTPVSPDSPRVGAPGQHVRGARVGRPQAKLTSWWSGKYVAAGVPVQNPNDPARRASPVGVAPEPMHNGSRPLRAVDDRKPAAQQVKAARKRAQSMRNTAGNRMRSNRRRSSYGNTPGVAVAFAGFSGVVMLLAVGALVIALFAPAFSGESYEAVAPSTPLPPIVSADGTQVIAQSGQFAIAQAGNQNEVSFNNQLSQIPQVDAQVLMVPMLSQPIDPGMMSELQAGIEQLRSKGLTILGDIAGNGDDDLVIEQTAELANTIGSIPVDSPEFIAKIQQWVGTKPLDGVLVFGKMPGETEERSAMLVMEKLHTIVPISDRTVHDLLLVLNSNGYTSD